MYIKYGIQPLLPQETLHISSSDKSANTHLNKQQLKVKTPTTRTEIAWGRGTAPTHSRPLGTSWGEWLASRPGRALAPRKGPPVPIVQEAGWAPKPAWTQEARGKILSPLSGIEPRSSSP
jgi:hypothetical protein